MKERLINTIELENHLQINMFDGSKKLVGDRWNVMLVSRMEIPVDGRVWPEKSPDAPGLETVRQILGETVVFKKKQERHFIDEQEKENVLQDMVDYFNGNILSYLQNPIFPKQFVLKRYTELANSMTGY